MEGRWNLLRGEAFVTLGKEKEGKAVMQEGIAECKSIEVRVYFPRTLIFLAKASGNLGEIEDGCKYLIKAHVNIQETGERCCETKLYRLQGRIHQLQVKDIEAKASFQNAIMVAKNEDAKMWELRATVDLAKLWQQHGRLGEVAKLLAEIYNWFTEGFDTPDLIEARALLDQFSQTKFTKEG